MTAVKPHGSSRRQLLEAIERQILPQLQSEHTCKILLAEPPFHLPAGATIRLHEGKPLAQNRARQRNQLSSVISLWAETNVHSNSVPYMGFVLDGEIDWRIGITSAMARKYGGELRSRQYAVFGLPESTFFLAPPGTPYGTGINSHWERNTLAPRRSIFWVRFYPFGVQCHISRGDAQSYRSKGPACIFSESRLYHAAETLLEELRTHDTDSLQAARGLLIFIMARLERGLKKMQTFDWRPIGPEYTETDNTTYAIEAACRYIEANFHRKLPLKEIAAHALISPTYLCHIFREEKGKTLTEHITELRMEYASSLLQHTHLNIKQISRTIGYTNQAYFCQVFSKRFGCAPSGFRKNIKKQKGS